MRILSRSEGGFYACFEGDFGVNFLADFKGDFDRF